VERNKRKIVMKKGFSGGDVKATKCLQFSAGENRKNGNGVQIAVIQGWGALPDPSALY